MPPRRRGEGQFVAAPIGFWNNPRVLDVADELRVPAGLAGSFILRWDELVLSDGDGLTGKLRGYNSRQLARHVGWTGKPEKLVRALKLGGVLAIKGRVFIRPHWLETPTGYYAWKKAKDRDRKRTNGADDTEHQNGVSAEAPRNVHANSTEDRTERKKGTAEGPPGAPQGGVGVSAGGDRWSWFAENYPRVENPELCKRYLAALSDESWDQLRYALPVQLKSGVWKKTRFIPVAPKYLRDEKFWAVKRPKPAEPKVVVADAETAEKRQARAAAEDAERRESWLAFSRAVFLDPEAPAAMKEARRAQWLREFPDVPLPPEATAS